MNIDIGRIVLTFIFQIIVVIVFGYLGYSIFTRRKNRMNKYFAVFFILLTLGNIINIIYVLIYGFIGLESVVVYLHLSTNFLNFLGLPFLYIVNQMILKSSIVFSIDRIKKYLVPYILILIIGTILIQIFDGVTWDPFGYPHWSLTYFLFALILSIGLAMIPALVISFKVYAQLNEKQVKRRYLFFLVGTIGLTLLLVIIYFSNFLNVMILRSILSIISLSMIIWVIFIYYGLRRSKE